MAEQLLMQHPKLPHTAPGAVNEDPDGVEWGPVLVTRDAFENAWKRKGWLEVPPEEAGYAAPENVPGTVGTQPDLNTVAGETASDVPDETRSKPGRSR